MNGRTGNVHLAVIAVLLCAAGAGLTLSGPLLALSRHEVPGRAQRTLTFEERVSFQRAIEEVYWRHRIWPKERPDLKPSLDAMISQAQLEEKVRDYLRSSQALADEWQRAITNEQLQAEMDRMAQNTRQPEVLRELFEALQNDPFVIAECLARPVLTERLLCDQYGMVDLSASQRTTVGVKDKRANQISAPVAAPNSRYRLPTISDATGGCTDDTWTATAIAPFVRDSHTAVWTGTEMIVWGGLCTDCAVYPNSGARYNPSTDSWTATSTANAPSGRWGHTAVWTGSEMIIWGGVVDGVVNTGARYNPVSNSWTATSTTNAPSAQGNHTAVWTGNEMIIWDTGRVGGRYNPNTNSWTAISTTNAPPVSIDPTAVWTGSEMIVWGCSDIDPKFGICIRDSGGRYNPNTDSWTATSDSNAPPSRYGQRAVWTGTEMIVWGGSDGINLVNTGGRYSPDTDSWVETSMTNAPSGRGSHSAIWDGSEMIVWGGLGIGTLNTGGRYNPSTDSWTATSTANAPTSRANHTAVWTGREMIVWGGINISTSLDTGGRYCQQSGPSHSRYDFNGDGNPDYVLYNATTRQTAIWYLINHIYQTGAFGPTLPPGWGLVDTADFNEDGRPDYVLYNATTRQTAIWYLNNNLYLGGAYGPTLPTGWQLLAVGDFNGDNKPDYVLYNASTRQTAIWYLNNNVYVHGAYGPTIAGGYLVSGVADFNGDGKPDYVLYNASTRQTAIWYLNNNVYVSGAYGPTAALGYVLSGVADFNVDGHPDYLLYNSTTHRTAIWYLNNNVYVSAAYGPTLPIGWNLVAP